MRSRLEARAAGRYTPAMGIGRDRRCLEHGDPREYERVRLECYSLRQGIAPVRNRAATLRLDVTEGFSPQATMVSKTLLMTFAAGVVIGFLIGWGAATSRTSPRAPDAPWPIARRKS